MLLFFSSRVFAATESLVTNIIIQTINANTQIIMQRIFVADFPTESIQMTVGILFKSSTVGAQFKFY